MSELKTNKVSPATGTALAVGDSGDTITVPSGATLDISASTLTPPATMPASSGVNLTALNATEVTSGTLPIARVADNAVTLAKLEDGTQGDVLYYGASGAPTRLGFGTSGDFLKTQGTGANPVWASAGGGGFNSVQIFTSSGTWTRPAGIIKVIMEVQGAGGSGGYADAAYNGAGAGAGGYAKKFLDVSSISSSTIVVGSGGTAGGVSGGLSSWADGANTVTGSGGTQGGGGAAGGGYHGTGGAGGAASGGDINIGGMSGFGLFYAGVKGGDSVLGFGNQQTTNDMNSYDGGDGLGYGSGGGGATATSGSGGDGKNGIVIVWEYK